MLKQGRDLSSHQKSFACRALQESGLRLDCRGPHEARQVSISLSRDEAHSEAHVVIGNTRVVCVVSGRLVAPYPDRPTEGSLLVSARLSVRAEACGLVQGELQRSLERALKESDCLDLESLCVTAGELVWTIACDVALLDYDGASVDAAVLSAVAALRAFRRPDVSLSHSGSLSGSLTLHSADEREPLPLAMHHSPLAVTAAIITASAPLQQKSSAAPLSSLSASLLLMDPSLLEEAAQEGAVTFSFNAHRELCGLSKHGAASSAGGGGGALSAAALVAGSAIAAEIAASRHAELSVALAELESSIERERSSRLLMMATRRRRQQVVDGAGGEQGGQREREARDEEEETEGGGIDRNDPVLSYGLVHREVFVSR